MTNKLVRPFKISTKLIESGFFDDSALDAMEYCGILQPGTYKRADRNFVTKESIIKVLEDLDYEEPVEVTETILDLSSIRRIADVNIFSGNQNINTKALVDLQGNYIIPDTTLEVFPGARLTDQDTGSYMIKYTSNIYINGNIAAVRLEVTDADL